MRMDDRDDNAQEYCLPFKGPFKGKGQTRKAVRMLDAEMDAIREEMVRVVEAYNDTFPTTPRPVNLRILNRPMAHSLLSWRQARHSGSYLQLFGAETGEEILSRLGPNAVNLLAKFDRERLRLNFRCKLIWSARHAYQLYQEGLDSQIAWFEAGHASDGVLRSAS